MTSIVHRFTTTTSRSNRCDNLKSVLCSVQVDRVESGEIARDADRCRLLAAVVRCLRDVTDASVRPFDKRGLGSCSESIIPGLFETRPNKRFQCFLLHFVDRGNGAKGDGGHFTWVHGVQSTAYLESSLTFIIGVVFQALIAAVELL